MPNQRPQRRVRSALPARPWGRRRRNASPARTGCSARRPRALRFARRAGLPALVADSVPQAVTPAPHLARQLPAARLGLHSAWPWPEAWALGLCLALRLPVASGSRSVSRQQAVVSPCWEPPPGQATRSARHRLEAEHRACAHPLLFPALSERRAEKELHWAPLPTAGLRSELGREALPKAQPSGQVWRRAVGWLVLAPQQAALQQAAELIAPLAQPEESPEAELIVLPEVWAAEAERVSRPEVGAAAEAGLVAPPGVAAAEAEQVSQPEEVAAEAERVLPREAAVAAEPRPAFAVLSFSFLLLLSSSVPRSLAARPLAPATDRLRQTARPLLLPSPVGR